VTEPAVRPLHHIHDDIVKHWPEPYFGAVPYITAMRYLGTMTDSYGEDPASDIVMYFLVNAKNWRGEHARRIKAELKSMLEGSR
jgi:hypothetical protein